MAAGQNVVVAVDGGLLALIAAVLAVGLCYALVPLMSRLVPQGITLPRVAADDTSRSVP